MKLYPAIDLKDNQVVRLYQGDFDQVTTYAKDPLVVAQNFVAQGAKYLHIVDLDGAKNKQTQHLEVIKRIANETKLTIQAGGGIRQQSQLDDLFNAGVSSVIIGSTAINNPSLVYQWLNLYGSAKITIALDVKLNNNNQPEVLTHGWLDNSNQLLWDIVIKLQQAGAKKILCTDVSRDGTLQGPNFELYQTALAKFPSMQWQASGGIRSSEDLQQLDTLGLSAAVVGKAIYDNKIDSRGKNVKQKNYSLS
jgi:phosphoribosylformimino-5-aminoimidazole carboxamide ribotide isomerase